MHIDEDRSDTSEISTASASRERWTGSNSTNGNSTSRLRRASSSIKSSPRASPRNSSSGGRSYTRGSSGSSGSGSQTARRSSSVKRETSSSRRDKERSVTGSGSSSGGRKEEFERLLQRRNGRQGTRLSSSSHGSLTRSSEGSASARGVELKSRADRPKAPIQRRASFNSARPSSKNHVRANSRLGSATARSLSNAPKVPQQRKPVIGRGKSNVVPASWSTVKPTYMHRMSFIYISLHFSQDCYFKYIYIYKYIYIKSVMYTLLYLSHVRYIIVSLCVSSLYCYCVVALITLITL